MAGPVRGAHVRLGVYEKWVGSRETGDGRRDWDVRRGVSGRSPPTGSCPCQYHSSARPQRLTPSLSPLAPSLVHVALTRPSPANQTNHVTTQTPPNPHQPPVQALPLRPAHHPSRKGSWARPHPKMRKSWSHSRASNSTWLLSMQKVSSLRAMTSTAIGQSFLPPSLPSMQRSTPRLSTR